MPNYDYNISNTINDTIIRGTTNSDVIYSMASNVTIQSGNGSDTIRIAARTNSANTNVVINGEAGNDRLENYGADKSKIDGGTGNDTIDN